MRTTPDQKYRLSFVGCAFTCVQSWLLSFVPTSPTQTTPPCSGPLLACHAGTPLSRPTFLCRSTDITAPATRAIAAASCRTSTHRLVELARVAAGCPRHALSRACRPRVPHAGGVCAPPCCRGVPQPPRQAGGGGGAGGQAFPGGTDHGPAGPGVCGECAPEEGCSCALRHWTHTRCPP